MVVSTDATGSVLATMIDDNYDVNLWADMMAVDMLIVVVATGHVAATDLVVLIR